MIIRILLIVAVSGLLVRFMGQRTSGRGQAWGKIAAVLFFMLAVIAIIAPSFTNKAAHLVGVGRGADLLLYTLVVAFLINLLVQHVHRGDDKERLILLVRRIAISEANQSARNSKLTTGFEREINQ